MTRSLEDFPAAHSMDTEWFAVDAEGRVARFDTGEDGALPELAATGFGPGDPNFDLDELCALRVAHLLAHGTDPAGDWRTEASLGRTLFVSDAPDAAQAQESARQALGSAPFDLLSEVPPFVLLTRGDISLKQVEALRADSSVRWTLDLRDSRELLNDGEGDDGLFQYTRDHGEDPGLYSLARAPSAPLKLGERAPEIAKAVARFRLPVHFPEAPTVHLADHISDAEAQTWGDLPLRYSERDLARQEQEWAKIKAREARLATGEAQIPPGIKLLALIAAICLLWWLLR